LLNKKEIAMNRLLLTKIIFLALILSLLGCSTKKPTYNLDPEFSLLQEQTNKSSVVAVKVIDNRQKTIELQGNKQTVLSSSHKDAEVLQDKLISRLKQQGHKIINKPLLADIAYEIELNRLSLTFETAMFKSEFAANSEIKLTVRRHSQHWTKIFRSSKTQEVANPATDRDATGIINQLLSQQLESAFSDNSLLEFLSKTQ